MGVSFKFCVCMALKMNDSRLMISRIHGMVGLFARDTVLT